MRTAAAKALDSVFISYLKLIKPEMNYCRGGGGGGGGPSVNGGECSFKSSLSSFLCLINPGVVIGRSGSYNYNEVLWQMVAMFIKKPETLEKFFCVCNFNL